MLDNNAAKVITAPQYEKFVDSWNSLEAAQDSYMEVAEIDIEEDPEGLKYLDDPALRYQNLLKRYAEYLNNSIDAERTAESVSRKEIEGEKKAAAEDLLRKEQGLKFLSSKAELETSIDSFKRMVIGVKESVKKSADAVKRSEVEKVDVEFKSVKDLLVKLAGVDEEKDLTDVRKSFVDNAEKVYFEFRDTILPELKDVVATSGDSRSSFSTKQEPVKFPQFKGDDSSSPSPFLTFPIWFKQWKTMILDYDEKFRAGMLYDCVDAAARSTFTGFESDYEESITRLEKFYGGSQKVVECVMKEVHDPDPLAEDDYSRLVDYANIIENNFNRLTSMNLQHEMSNTTTMSVIVKKFPRVIEERWHDYLIDKTPDEKADPFPVFITWLKRQKEKWSCMVASEVGWRGESSLYARGENTGAAGKQCFNCGDMGHISQNCPKRQKENHDRNTGGRRKPKVKKF